MMLMEHFANWDMNDTQHQDHRHSQQSWGNQQWPSEQHSQQHGQWMLCENWCDCPPHVNGWLYVQGCFQWGVVLTWHVQKMIFTEPGSLVWVCLLWRKDEAGSWKVSLQKQERIPTEDICKYPDWMIHVPAGGAAQTDKIYIYAYSKKKNIYIYKILPPSWEVPSQLGGPTS